MLGVKKRFKQGEHVAFHKLNVQGVSKGERGRTMGIAFLPKFIEIKRRTNQEMTNASEVTVGAPSGENACRTNQAENACRTNQIKGPKPQGAQSHLRRCSKDTKKASIWSERGTHGARTRTPRLESGGSNGQMRGPYAGSGRHVQAFK